MRIDRERFGELNAAARDALRDMADLRAKHPGEKVVGRNDFVEQMHFLFKAQYENLGREKILLFSKRVARRVDKMDVRSLLGPVELMAPVLQKDECGYIVIPKESWNEKYDLSAFYAIIEGRLYMNVCSGAHKVGYVVVDKEFSGGIEILPWSLLTMLRLHKFPHRDEMKPWAPLFEALAGDFPEVMNGDLSTVYATLENKRSLEKFKKENHKSMPVFQVHAFAWGQVLMAFKAFVFLKTSEVYSQEYVPDSTPSIFRRKKGFRPFNYIQVDCTWDMDIDVNNPFPVRGHFRRQPVLDPDGKWTHKLIYIEPFMKTGYHRKARKTQEHM